MAPADAEYGLAFIAFDCPVYTLAVLVAYLSAKVCRVDRRLFARWELMPQHLIVPVHHLDRAKFHYGQG